MQFQEPLSLKDIVLLHRTPPMRFLKLVNSVICPAGILGTADALVPMDGAGICGGDLCNGASRDLNRCGLLPQISTALDISEPFVLGTTPASFEWNVGLGACDWTQQEAAHS